MAGLDAPTTVDVIGRGLRCRCPRCGRANLFDGFLKVTARCAACGLGFGGHDAGDGPAVFIVLVVGAVVAGLALLTEIALAPPLWVHALLWTPLIVALSLAGLRPLKGVTVALQYKFRSVEKPAEPGGQ
ncbi:MAG: DUF983 domain-containing protein [Rhodospirillales bacterium]|jgi:uncharacterized protein (DUF983 family)|nr:DUF983 domain-containing protein [Rhodospirillales bacterium]